MNTIAHRIHTGLVVAAFGAGLLTALPLQATETENRGFRVLPAPGKVAIDGKTDDWDLSGGIFACGDVEHLRDQYAVWFHAMYDKDNIYLLARWNDPTPMNNPENFGGHGFNADCLQVRFIVFPEAVDKVATWWTLWRDARGQTVADRSSPGPRNGFAENPLDPLPRAEEQGVQQAFLAFPDGKGYAQEVAIPWKLLTANGMAPQPGESFRMTIEPNFTAGAYGRITIKDLFDANTAAPDRIFTFRAFKHWGTATLEPRGHVDPQPVRLADRRTFPVTLKDGIPTVDWTGVIAKFEWPGFKPVNFAMPFDGYVSLNIIAPDGSVARHLLNWDRRTKGPVTVKWDGLSDATYRTPGEPLPAGDYTWKAIAHPGAKLTFRGYACYGGRVPWNSGPKDEWLGDHGVPSDVVTDGERMYLACNGAEGGRHLIATDLKGTLIWGLQNTTGAADPEHIAVADGSVYILHPKAVWMGTGGTITRATAATGAYDMWPGTKSHILPIASVWPEGQPGPDHLDGIDAHAGKLYVSASDPSFFTQDVADWKALIQQLRSGTPLARRIMAEVDPETCTRLDGFLADKVAQDKAFATWNGGPRFDNEVVLALNALLAARDVAPDTAALSPAACALANRRFLEQTFGAALHPKGPDTVAVLDIANGKVTRTWPVPLAGALRAADATHVYVVSGGSSIVVLDPTTGRLTPFADRLSNAKGLALDRAGHVYASVDAPDRQVIVFDAKGRESARIGRKGGRAPLGPWQADGLFAPAGIAVDRENKLWVMEHDRHPKRVSVWNLADGAFVADFFGPTHYGASGSAINPRDPNLMVGVGCEWRLDPRTGKSACVGAFDRQYHEFAAFREGANGRLYLYTVYGDHGRGGVQVFERLGDANYALRAVLRNAGDQRKGPGRAELWVDANGDGQEQPGEVQSQEGILFCESNNGWCLNLGPDLTLYPFDIKDKTLKALPAAGFNACGAPAYSLATLRPMPAAMSAGYERGSGCAVPSADNKMILVNLRVKDHPAKFVWHGFDLATGALKWTYPNPYYQVHGSHNAPAPEPGLFRGAFGPVGEVALAGAAGNAWIINGNVGEWNVLTSEGFYLTRLFNGNIFEWKWPADTTPGSDMTDVPPGCGGEDFGGSVTQASDPSAGSGHGGRVFVQGGKNGIWNLELTGLDQAVALPGGKLTLAPEDTKRALALRDDALQTAAAGAKLVVKRATTPLTGILARDFAGATIVDYQKTEDARVRTALTHDDTTLYIGWEVRDSTPWINGATDISQMYACGDTVDLQLGTDAAADPKRGKAARGDIRLSIGNLQGKPTAVLYKFVSTDKKPRTFTSGVIKGYEVDWVDALADARIQVRTIKDGYTVEAAIPLATLGIKLTPNLALRGDVGVTHADPSGTRTKLRTHWANQQTGLVDDVVFELQIAPQNWGELVFE